MRLNFRFRRVSLRRMNPVPPPQRAAIIVNPVSGRARSRRRARKVLYWLAREGVSVLLHETKGPGDARLAAARLAREVDVLVSVGGDGTLNDTLNGVMDAGAQTPILVVSSGTANVVASELHLPLKIQPLVTTALAGHFRAVDIGVIRKPGSATLRRFAMCTGAGFDAAVVEGVQPVRTAAGITRWAYAWPILGALIRYKFPPMRVTLDGAVVEEEALFTVVANTRRYGGEFQICAKAAMDDGLLDICCLNRRGLGALLRFGWSVLCRSSGPVPGVKFFRGKTVELESKQRVPVQVDGDPGGELPLRIEVLPKAVNFCVPESAAASAEPPGFRRLPFSTEA